MAPLEMQTGKTEYQVQMVDRAATRPPRAGQADGLRVATPEDLVVLKLIAFRAKDRVDLIALLRRPALDLEYVRRWCDIWEVTDRLHRAQAWAGEED